MPSIRESRIKKGLTQLQLATIMKVSVHQVSAWERGVTQPRLVNVKKLCSILHLSIDNLDFPMSQEDVDILITIKRDQSHEAITVVNSVISMVGVSQDESHKDLDIVRTNSDKTPTHRRIKFTNPSYEDTWNIRFVDPYRIDHEES